MKRFIIFQLRDPKTILVTVFALSFSLLSFVIFNLHTLEFEKERAQVYNTAANYSYDIKFNIDRALSSTYTLQALLTQNDGAFIRNFEEIAREILPSYPGVIEFAIFINMGIPAYTGTVLPFIASIVIGTIQLGATVDYAILMTNKYKKNRFRGMDKKEAITDALSKSIQSIIVSALSFFAATFGVGLYSNIDMIGSLCMLMARGAIISMIVVIFILPSMFMVFDRVICASSAGFRNKIK